MSYCFFSYQLFSNNYTIQGAGKVNKIQFEKKGFLFSESVIFHIFQVKSYSNFSTLYSNQIDSFFNWFFRISDKYIIPFLYVYFSAQCYQSYFIQLSFVNVYTSFFICINEGLYNDYFINFFISSGFSNASKVKQFAPQSYVQFIRELVVARPPIFLDFSRRFNVIGIF
ncbi:hypothetical protein IMG5_031510 [Ichthyophthirius multifiliis]|uniref:Uncharacterized protein n=1 Tax=Ichthyophthirius multifiliis TaxID=5932 RepID=G0QLJ7_ICHMU|nr:hypothetical protein IMG5_031510 [Ichthyophthirius multifiliis]EGR33910.1 hypothetical protein IMG5_031510 [Ichthyophthirius multifiliis]|eukprot:XP_004039214.1 hypothetical protein IMG5_031510 [Ichthyophthirius multifiliis]